MAKTEEFIARIFLNNEQAKSKIAELEAKMGELRAARDKAFAAGDTKAAESYKKELISTSKSLSAMHASAAKVGRTIDGLSSQSLSDINKTIKAINRELASGRVERGSADWHRLTEALRECKNEAARIKSEISDTSTRTSSLGMRVAGWATAMRAAFDVVGGVWQKAQDFVSAFAQMDEALADTRKYTGLSGEAVGQLQEKLKQMDTRTSREELNALAGAAGRLGITAVDDIFGTIAS